MGGTVLRAFWKAVSQIYKPLVSSNKIFHFFLRWTDWFLLMLKQSRAALKPSRFHCGPSRHGGLFLLSPVSWRQDSHLCDLPLVPKGRFQQLLIKGAAKKPPEARLKGPEKLIKIRRLGLSWWHSRESPTKCRGQRLDPWSGRIPHAVEQPSPDTETTTARKF